jgi:spermidine/putrescine transport system permease protein
MLPNYARAAQDLGAGSWAMFRHVIPPGVMIGAFLAFVLCIRDYISPQVMGGNAELTLLQLIMLQTGRCGNFPRASALSVVLMAVVTLVYLGCSRWLRLHRL